MCDCKSAERRQLIYALNPSQCDGQHPCNTCVRAGDRCDYGMPKKRGPPKGSTRSSSKNAALRQASITPSCSSATLPVSLQADIPRPGPSQLTHTATGSPAAYSSESRTAYDSAHSMPSPQVSSSMSAASHSHGLNGRSDAPPNPVPSRPGLAFPPPQLPRASQCIVDSRHGSYTSLPDIGGFTRPKFRGGSSGILDFPSPNLSRSLYHNSGSPDVTGVGFTSPSSFALSKRIDDTPGTMSNGGGHSSRAAMSSPFSRLPSFNSPRCDAPVSTSANGHSATPGDTTTANSFINSLELARSDRYDLDAIPRCIHHPEIPEATEDTIWTLWWQIIAMHWPILLGDDLPIIRGQRRIDIHKQPLLYNAMAALASRIWDVEKDGPIQPMQLSDGVSARSPTSEELSDIYFLRARYWLLRNNCESSLETAQALLCMSLRESGSGQSSASAEYCMSACRTALELGLHRDFSNRGLSKEETQARLRTWWSIYVLDKTNSAMLGRPCVLRFEESDAPLLDMEMNEEYRGWQPSRYDHSPASKILAGQPVRSLSYFVYGSKLAAICENIVLQYNNVRPKTQSGTRNGASEPCEPWDVSVSRLHHKLEEWERSLPAHLKEQQDGPTFQHVLCQRMWACACRIILHRPYILKQSADPSLPPSHLVCKESAHELCRLVSKYKRDHGTRKLSSTLVYCVFTAATILLADTTSPVAAAAQEAKRYLAECTQHLGNMSGTWTNATVHLNILRHLGNSLDADMTGTGLEAVGEVGLPASAGASAIESFGGSIGPAVRAGHQRMVPALVGSSASDGLNGAVVGGAGMGLASTQDVNGGSYNVIANGAPVNIQHARSSLSEDRFFEINDEVSGREGGAALIRWQLLTVHCSLLTQAYWGQMPLSSENPQAWEMFTSKYLQTLNSASLAAGSVN